MTIYIIILHYGEIKNTLTCLKSVAKLKKDRMTVKVILVDNDFTSEEPWLFPLSGISLSPSEVVIIRNSSNLGFAAGVNIGIKAALKDKKTDYILILNNDTVVPPNLLTELLKTQADIISPVLKYKNNKGLWRYDYGGKINWWIGRTKHIECNNVTMKPASPAGRQCNNFEIDYVSGCCMLVKREVFEIVGLFDQAFFMYFEDADFCTRAKNKGFIIAVNPSVTVFHQLGGSNTQKSFSAKSHLLKSNFIFIRNHLGMRIPLGLFYLLLLSLKILFSRK